MKEYNEVGEQRRKMRYHCEKIRAFKYFFSEEAKPFCSFVVVFPVVPSLFTNLIHLLKM